MNFKKKLLILLLLMIFSNFLKSQSVEYSVKALYIEKFARFTDWENDFGGENFVITILGDSPFNGELEKLAKKTKIKNKPIKIIYIKNLEEIKDCNLLFICSSERNNISDIIKQMENISTLIVADIPDSCKKGVHLSFYIDDTGTIHYEVNPKSLKKAKLTVDMQLLSFGKIIN
jgi:hypothetical protein